MDAIHYKTREDGKVVQTASYTILGVNQMGCKEVHMSEAEGANFWLQVLILSSNLISKYGILSSKLNRR
ncbi:transposase [Candidatus Magnetominusculus xianensis]|uniref:Transposase n=1 Tax=Candidatus Magnetominusculus xianensis TaxID=1748249 RepID=A0ABR5SEI6_9BACT|nr:transposase [Candidatus Magnetominusculus xianensis]